MAATQPAVAWTGFIPLITRLLSMLGGILTYHNWNAVQGLGGFETATQAAAVFGVGGASAALLCAGEWIGHKTHASAVTTALNTTPPVASGPTAGSTISFDAGGVSLRMVISGPVTTAQQKAIVTAVDSALGVSGGGK